MVTSYEKSIIARLPRTKCGRSVLPGDYVWHPKDINPPSPVYLNTTFSDIKDATVYISTRIGRDNFVCRVEEVPVSECYFSEIAMLADLKGKGN
jgi:hypothetical protein